MSALPATAQQRAVQNYRARLKKRGLTWFEVLGRVADRDLVRTIAKCLAEEGTDAMHLRAAVSQTIGGTANAKGGIAAALRRSPLVGADLDLERPFEAGRDVTF
jgi:hypothetical protein